MARHPETELVVVCHDGRLDRERTDRFPLWDALFEDAQGGRDDPDTVAGIVFANVDER